MPERIRRTAFYIICKKILPPGTVKGGRGMKTSLIKLADHRTILLLKGAKPNTRYTGPRGLGCARCGTDEATFHLFLK